MSVNDHQCCEKALGYRIHWSGKFRWVARIGREYCDDGQKASSRLETSGHVAKFRGTASFKIYSPHPCSPVPRKLIYSAYVSNVPHFSSSISFYISNQRPSFSALILIICPTISAIVAESMAPCLTKNIGARCSNFYYTYLIFTKLLSCHSFNKPILFDERAAIETFLFHRSIVATFFKRPCNET